MSPEIKLLFIGDSLTEWFDWAERFPSYSVMNMGISGETAEDLHKRLELVRDKAGNPDYIFMMTGINDILQEYYDSLKSACEMIIDKLGLLFPNSIIVVQSLLPIALPWTDNKIIKEYNDYLHEYSKKQGCRYLDVYKAFSDSSGLPLKGYLSPDGVHLSEKGYEVWAHEIERFLISKS